MQGLWVDEFGSSEYREIDDEKDTEGFTPLMYAAKYGRLEMVEHLVRSGVNVNEKGSRGRTALDLAIQYERAAVVHSLVASKAKVDGIPRAILNRFSIPATANDDSVQ